MNLKSGFFLPRNTIKLALFSSLGLFFGFSNLYSQEYIFGLESFEIKNDSAWKFVNANQSNLQSYKGNKSIEIKSKGSFSYDILIPEGVQEIVVKANLKLQNSTKLKGTKFYKKGILRIVNIENSEIAFVSTNSEWLSFEKEIKLPVGTKEITIICENLDEKGILYLDNLIVEKRQTGFVKSEMPWASKIVERRSKANQIIKNGDFEDGSSNWNSYWGLSLTQNSHSGDNACQISNDNKTDWKGTNNDKPYFIPEGTTKLRVTAWVKADNIESNGNAWETAAILLTLADEKNNEIPGGDAVARTTGTHDWKQFVAYFNVSERAKSFNLRLVLAACSGSVFFDDIVAEPLTEEEYIAINSKLQNSGFEEDLNGWPTYAGIVTTEEVHSGEFALKVSGDIAAWEMREQKVFLKEGTKELIVSAWMKTVDVTKTPNNWEGGRIFVDFYDVNGLSLGDGIGVARAVGNTDWTLFMQLVKVPQDAAGVKISCGRANVTGNVYIDDVMLTVFGEAEYEIEKTKIKNPDFELGLFAWPQYAGSVTKDIVHSGNLALVVAGDTAMWKVRTQSLLVKKDAKEVTVGVWMKTENVSKGNFEWEGARTYVDFKDAKGQPIGEVMTIAYANGTSDWTFYTKKIKIPENAVEMIISCGRTNVTGKIYFDDLSVEY